MGSPRETAPASSLQRSAIDDWFLRPEQRGNPHTRIDEASDPGSSWTAGNEVRLPMHGAEYFSRLVEALSNLTAEDEVMILDRRGDEEERLRSDGPTLGELLAAL